MAASWQQDGSKMAARWQHDGSRLAAYGQQNGSKAVIMKEDTEQMYLAERTIKGTQYP
jgi:hypothetical protein